MQELRQRKGGRRELASWIVEGMARGGRIKPAISKRGIEALVPYQRELDMGDHRCRWKSPRCWPEMVYPWPYRRQACWRCDQCIQPGSWGVTSLWTEGYHCKEGCRRGHSHIWWMGMQNQEDITDPGGSCLVHSTVHFSGCTQGEHSMLGNDQQWCHPLCGLDAWSAGNHHCASDEKSTTRRTVESKCPCCDQHHGRVHTVKPEDWKIFQEWCLWVELHG